MKTSRLFQQGFFFIPLLAILVAFGIVFTQYARRDRIKQELAATESEYARCEGRLNDLHKLLKQAHR